jgi:hypothetical protein
MAKQLIITAGLIGAAIFAVFLSGRGSGDESALAVIHRLQLAHAQLNSIYFLNPPPPNDYPAVVATVDGASISGDALASRQVVLELNKRQWLKTLPADVPSDFVTQHLGDIDAEDPLDYLIDQELERQAVIRLGYTPSEEDAAALAAKIEEVTKQDMQAATATPGAEQQYVELNAAQGLPASNWASDTAYVNRTRAVLGDIRLRKSICSQPTPTQTPTLNELFSGNNCAAYRDFLQRERKHADIVYFVRWAD